MTSRYGADRRPTGRRSARRAELALVVAVVPVLGVATAGVVVWLAVATVVGVALVRVVRWLNEFDQRR